jgi:hypothetical protein
MLEKGGQHRKLRWGVGDVVWRRAAAWEG